MKHIKDLILAWSVHLITASGLVLGFYSIIAIVNGNYDVLMKLVILVLIIDGIDGTLARKFRVKEVLPQIDGGLLDNIVDYLNYTFITAIFFYYSSFIEEPYKTPLCLGILLASAYQFVRTDAKTDDDYFRGFPSVWNFFILLNIIFNVEPSINIILISAGIIFSFFPIKFIYPSKTKEFKIITIPFTVITILSMCLAIFFKLNDFYLSITKIIVITYLVYLTVMSLYLTYKTRSKE